uniref:Uncharacterized protein n=1 Tax=Ditylenchus dipsaci TaxID=166011 RepID=A0A915D484_9BILA
MLLDKLLSKRPFRGLRRAASASTSSISCCSSSSPSSAHLGAAALSSSSALSAYPYPRSHTTLMVLPAAGTAVATNNTPRGSANISGSRSAGSASSSRYGSKEWLTNSMLMEEDGGGSGDYDNNNLILNYPNNAGDGNNNNTSEPPLNRAIPPIPESKSNESIISAQSSSLAASSTARRQSITNNNNAGGTIGSTTMDTHMALAEVIEDKSVVIENPMAQNLGLNHQQDHNKKGSHSKTLQDPTKSP